jgi:membrane-bound lytic murein transglycosylase B
VSAHEGLTQTESKQLDDARKEFDMWLQNVRMDAMNRGVSEELLNWAFKDVTVSKDSVVKRKYAPEVKLVLDAYLDRMVVEQRVAIGATRLKENAELLTEISQKFGVPSHFLVSIWGMETNYGSYTGNSDIIQALATMGFTEAQESRRKYFRGELLEVLSMIQNGTAQRGIGPQGEKRLLGSWAGAMGQCQFMPTSFRDYALDYDGDGRRDIWESKADILASIANYFKEHGWKSGGPIFQKVQVPKKLDKSLVGGGVVKSVLDWEHKHGVHLNPGKAPPLPPGEMASLLMPNGPKGEAYLVCDNFRVILRYNGSDLYGFAVCELARLIQERASNPYPTPPLSK